MANGIEGRVALITGASVDRASGCVPVRHAGRRGVRALHIRGRQGIPRQNHNGVAESCTRPIRLQAARSDRALEGRRSHAPVSRWCHVSCARGSDRGPSRTEPLSAVIALFANVRRLYLLLSVNKLSRRQLRVCGYLDPVSTVAWIST